MTQNTSTVSNPDRERPTRLEAARFYHSRGYVPVPIPLGRKGPRLDDWSKFRPHPDDFESLFGGTGNIGLLMGEPSGGLVDVDLDCPEAVELAPEFLPHTGAVIGRTGSPRSHYFYIAEGLQTKPFRDPHTRKMIIEIRSTNVASTVGPSLHPSGGHYEVLEARPTIVPAFILRDAVERIWKAVYTMRGHFPPPPRPIRATHVSDGELDAYSAAERFERAISYLAGIPAAVAGQGGHNQTFAAATALVHGFALPPDLVFQILRDQYNPRCQPPWSDTELTHKVNQAVSVPHDMPRGWLLKARPPRGTTG